MSYQTIDHHAQNRGHPERLDPRTALARHIGWHALTNTASYSDFTYPEPINYNYAVRAQRLIHCDFVRNSVFYRDLTENKWWSLYVVEKSAIRQFFDWVKLQPIDIFWFNRTPPQPRRVKRILYNTKPADINGNERLFQMGYYSKLQSKYFSEDDKKLLELLGPVRDRVLEGLGESS